MNRNHLKSALFLTLLLILFGCESSENKGTTGAWVKGKALSVNANFTDRSPYLELSIRNESEDLLKITPVKTTGWFKKQGRVESNYTLGDFEAESPMIAATFYAKNSNGQTREIVYEEKTPEIILEPGEEISIIANFWKTSDDNMFDMLEKVQIKIGGEDGTNRESFMIE